jgi:outer membrane protein
MKHRGQLLKIIVATITFLPFQISAQKTWTLKECIEYALRSNISVQQSYISVKLSEVNYQQSVGSFFPSINASGGLNYNYGRSLDPTTYQYINSTFQSGNGSLNASLPLFQGLELQNTFKKNKIDVRASEQDIVKTQNDVALAVASAYLQVLYSQEQFKAATDRIEQVTQERNRTKLLVDNELLAEGSLLDADALLATEEFNKVSAENLIRTSKLNLIQFMQLDSVSDITIESPTLEVPGQESLTLSADAIYAEAEKTLPEIKSADLRVFSAEKSIGIARAGRYPRLSMFGSLSSNFTNQATTIVGNPVLIGFAPTGAVTASGEQVLQPQYSYNYKDVSFGDQVNDNFGKAVGFSLSIPIFNGFAVNSNVNRAKLNFESAKLTARQTRNTTYKTIQQAHADAVAALNKYNAATKSADALQKSFTYTEKKYNAGLLNSLDYTTSRNNLTKAQSDLIQAKYDFVLKLKVLDFYLGKPLSF